MDDCRVLDRRRLALGPKPPGSRRAAPVGPKTALLFFSRPAIR